jgi:two-component system alkaline phosphatase synthesis response regulator PhoP
MDDRKPDPGAIMNTAQELEIIEIGPLFICPSTREVVLGPDATAAPLALTRLELDVVTALARRRGRPMTRDEMLDRVWGRGVAVAPHAVEAIISGIRKKLSPHRALLSTQRGVGYRLRLLGTHAISW